MAVVAAFLVPGSPLPYFKPDNPPWSGLANAMQQAGNALAQSGAESVVVYSTQWIAVLDQLWQTRAEITGVHVDENWHEYGELPYKVVIDKALTDAIIPATAQFDIRSKGVDYDAFPIDTGTIVANNLLNSDGALKLVVTSNNVYHDWSMTASLGRVAAEQAAALDRRVAIVGVGGLSGAFHRQAIDIAEDAIVNESDDEWNQRILSLMTEADCEALLEACPRFAQEARADMGFKHAAFVLGALGERFSSAKVHGYGPLYGAGGAVVEFTP